jgi:hypothetical protein
MVDCEQLDKKKTLFDVKVVMMQLLMAYKINEHLYSKASIKGVSYSPTSDNYYVFVDSYNCAEYIVNRLSTNKDLKFKELKISLFSSDTYCIDLVVGCKKRISDNIKNHLINYFAV